MGIAQSITPDDILADWEASFAALSWQVDLGVNEAMCEQPTNRYELTTPVKSAPPPIATSGPSSAPLAQQLTPAVHAEQDAVTVARAQATRAQSLTQLELAQAQFDLCELKKGARKHVFADGNAAARVMIFGEAPDSEEDREGTPFVGAAGRLLDAMFAAIGLSRTAQDPQHAVYLTNVMPWRPSGDRAPEADELAMMLPFVERHIALVDPAVIVVMGNAPLFALTGAKGILRKRGSWDVTFGKPVLPMLHPSYLLRNPLAKRDAWADLLALQSGLVTSTDIAR